MSEKKNNTVYTRKKAGKDLIQGRFFSLDFFKRNWYYVVFIVAMALAYIGNKFSSQRSIQELITLKTSWPTHKPTWSTRAQSTTP